MPSFSRQPAMGMNSNLSKGGFEYHVQTEDLVLKSKVRTQVFVDGGTVIHTDHYSYGEHLDKPDLTARLIKVMRACHQKVVRMVEQGAIVIEEVPQSIPIDPPPHSMIRNPSGIRPKTPSEVWDSVVQEARRRNNQRIRTSSRPPPCWDQVLKNLKKLG